MKAPMTRRKRGTDKYNSHYDIQATIIMASGLQPVPITPQKHDPAWKHVQMFKNGDRVQLKCIYCGKLFKGGGIHRIKEHLAGQKGNASSCLQVQQDVRLLMQQSLDGVVVKKRKKQKLAEEITGIHLPSNDIDTYDNNQCEVNTDIQLIANPIAIEPSSTLMVSHEAGTSSRGREKRKRGRPSKNSLVSASTDLITANGIEYEFKKPDCQVHMAIVQFLYDVGVPLDAVNSIYFQQLIDAISSQGMGVVAPSYHDLRGCVLKSLLEEGKTQIDHYARTWGRTGCSILVEEWCTDKGMILANFLVYCPEGTMFLKSADITNIANSSDTLFELLKEVVEEVGVRNVLQVITSSEEQYVVAGRKLSDAYPTLYWAPCAAGSLDLILDDFGKIEWIKVVLEQSKSITRFIYNHSVVLNMMRRCTFGVDLVVPRSTCSVSNFTTLKRMVEHKHNLQALVTSQEWVDSPYSKKEGGLALLDSISDNSFWSSCTLIVHLTNPLLQVLRIVSSQNKPSMGYIYAGIYRAKEIIKKELVKKEDYLGYWNIIDQRWAQSRHLPLHAAGFYLNPKFFYSIEGDLHGDFVSGMFDCIERLVPDTKVQDKIIKELNSYKHAVGDFGRKMAIRARDTVIPAEWWSTYGGGCPNLARLAVRILSQRCSLMHYKRDLIPFEQIHDTKNSLEHQRLTDLVFTQYNLRLRRMTDTTKEQDIVDPISFDSISVRDWIAGKELCLEDFGSSDWMALDPPSSNTTLSTDEAEELGAGFDDFEIFGVKDEEENI
ncbi:hypothetical protein Nepgr_006096 [Nepenthes gracilis]|uniref:BED-type domain-containing protein n=1 Tax=Nepenthes gracilis TaxID=150966 RepID=A0AAD3XH20_NEPGR|nr:hypothetical protein Nepgr_006096 [Nepenthes gracilis]